MTTAAAVVTAESKYRLAGWAGLASGVLGILSTACLIAYLTTQAQRFMATGVMPPLGAVLINGNNLGSMAQALCMIPVALALHDIARRRASGTSRAAMLVGVTALLGVALLRFLHAINPAFSDILFMGPTGFVGLWLLVVNVLLAGVLSGTLRVIGTIAGIGLLIVGASFFFLGGLIVLTGDPFAYGRDADFHVGITIGGVPGFILYPLWAILVGRRLMTRNPRTE